MPTCEHCGSYSNEYGDNWKTLCLSCWKREKRTKTNDADRVAYWRKRALFAESRLEFQANAPAPVSDLSADFRDHLKTLIFLCHPDKHGNDLGATDTTRFLLSLRELLR